MEKDSMIDQTDAGTVMSFPAEKGRGEYIWTFTGRKFFFGDENPDITIIDIAHALSLICRWTGHVSRFYSVAEHCCRCSVYPRTWEDYCNEKQQNKWKEPTFALRKLLHDSPEAYITDLNKPVKMVIGGKDSPYEQLDLKISIAIWKKYGLGPMSEAEARSVKEADLAMAMTEARDLLSQISVTHYEGARPLRNPIKPWHSDDAENAFLDRFKELM
jgi:5'-deoxynucleotidase YfbR-like HD superfamily hydrolase